MKIGRTTGHGSIMVRAAIATTAAERAAQTAVATDAGLDLTKSESRPFGLRTCWAGVKQPSAELVHPRPILALALLTQEQLDTGVHGLRNVYPIH